MMTNVPWFQLDLKIGFTIKRKDSSVTKLDKVVDVDRNDNDSIRHSISLKVLYQSLDDLLVTRFMFISNSLQIILTNLTLNL